MLEVPVSRRCHAEAELDEQITRTITLDCVTPRLDVGRMVDLDRVAP
jgi:hypothetical protein